jgi:dihydroorotate dehydrogenase
MGLGYRLFGRPLLRFQDSEKAHLRSLSMLRLAASTPPGRWMLKSLYKPRRSLPVTVFGQTYTHPFGLAAGMDKNAVALNGWSALGLAFIEIGGVTMHRQDGNPKPRMFRANQARALVNRMGFNNEGSEAIQARLQAYFSRHGRPSVPLWVNLGKSKITPLEDAHEDYATSMQRLWEFTDVFVINVSSPNTPQLRELQNDEGLTRILQACNEVNRACAEAHGAAEKPLLVKIAPDLDAQQLAMIVRTSQSGGASGMVVSNTTVQRPNGGDSSDARAFEQAGGMSGMPLKDRSTALIREVRALAGPDWPIVGVGGISSGRDAWEKIEAGATLLQAYSGFVFEGPSLTKSVVSGLHRLLAEHSMGGLDEARGSRDLNGEDC